MDAITFSIHLDKKISQKRDDLLVTLGTGNIENFEDYRYIVGQLRGLNYIESEIKSVMKKLEFE
tara:strand:- start:6379 stop:6570 length:192 start_codon:yes stop_codon:yes gene_type:complete